MADLIHRTVNDANFEHCARMLLPFCAQAVRSLSPGDVLDRDTLNCIGIATEVAEAFARERYGKPRFRIRARTKADLLNYDLVGRPCPAPAEPVLFEEDAHG